MNDNSRGSSSGQFLSDSRQKKRPRRSGTRRQFSTIETSQSSRSARRSDRTSSSPRQVDEKVHMPVQETPLIEEGLAIPFQSRLAVRRDKKEGWTESLRMGFNHESIRRLIEGLSRVSLGPVESLFRVYPSFIGGFRGISHGYHRTSLGHLSGIYQGFDVKQRTVLWEVRMDVDDLNTFITRYYETGFHSTRS